MNVLRNLFRFAYTLSALRIKSQIAFKYFYRKFTDLLFVYTATRDNILWDKIKAKLFNNSPLRMRPTINLRISFHLHALAFFIVATI